MVQTEKGYVREETCHHMIVNDLSVFGAPVFVWPELKNFRQHCIIEDRER